MRLFSMFFLLLVSSMARAGDRFPADGAALEGHEALAAEAALSLAPEPNQAPREESGASPWDLDDWESLSETTLSMYLSFGEDLEKLLGILLTVPVSAPVDLEEVLKNNLQQVRDAATVIERLRGELEDRAEKTGNSLDAIAKAGRGFSPQIGRGIIADAGELKQRIEAFQQHATQSVETANRVDNLITRQIETLAPGHPPGAVLEALEMVRAGNNTGDAKLRRVAFDLLTDPKVETMMDLREQADTLRVRANKAASGTLALELSLDSKLTKAEVAMAGAKTARPGGVTVGTLQVGELRTELSRLKGNLEKVAQEVDTARAEKDARAKEAKLLEVEVTLKALQLVETRVRADIAELPNLDALARSQLGVQQKYIETNFGRLRVEIAQMKAATGKKGK